MSGLFPENQAKKSEATTSLIPSTHTVYAVLGFLDEYSGRYVSEDNLIERFYPNETEKARIFQKYLLRLIQEYQLRPDLRSVVSDECTCFYSKELAQLINSYYLTHYLTGKDENGNPAYTRGQGFIRQNAGLISVEIFPPDDRESKFSFLIGAFQRYSQKGRNIFQFANAHHKAKLVQQLLVDVGSSQVVFVYSPPDCVPCVYGVAFEPTIELIDRMNLKLFG
jgi:hypothetical protein